MLGARQRKRAAITTLVAVGTLATLLIGASGCRDENDPNYWLGKMQDVVWRDQALTNIRRLFSQTMQDADNNRDAPEVQNFVNTVSGGLIESYNDMSSGGTEDVTSMNKIVSLLSEMDTPAALPVYRHALSDVSGTKIERANTAAAAVARFCISDEPHAEFIPPPSKQTDSWRQRCSAAAELTDVLIGAVDAINEQRSARGENAENTPEEDALARSLVSALGNILLGNPDIPQRDDIIAKLIAILETPDLVQDLRINMDALKMLGQIGDVAAVPVLVRALFIQGKRRQVALQEVARVSIMQVEDLNAMADALIKAGRMQDEALMRMQRADPNFDVRLIKEQVAITLGMLGIRSEPVLSYLMEELNHTEFDDFDGIPGRGQVTFTKERSRSVRRSFAAQALGKLHHDPALPTIIGRLRAKKTGDTWAPVEENVDFEEWPGYIDGAGDFLEPSKTNEVFLPFLVFGDDALLDRVGRRLALQAGPAVAQKVQQRATKMEDCEEETRARGCVKDNYLKRYVPMLQSGEGCTDVACWITKIGDNNANIRERAAYQLAMLAYGNEEASNQARTALLNALDESSADVSDAYIFAIDRLSPNGCGQECLTSLQKRIDTLRGRSTQHELRRALTGLRARLAFRAESSGPTKSE